VDRRPISRSPANVAPAIPIADTEADVARHPVLPGRAAIELQQLVPTFVPIVKSTLGFGLSCVQSDLVVFSSDDD
jgi:hypothetical protein